MVRKIEQNSFPRRLPTESKFWQVSWLVSSSETPFLPAVNIAAVDSQASLTYSCGAAFDFSGKMEGRNSLFIPTKEVSVIETPEQSIVKNNETVKY